MSSFGIVDTGFVIKLLSDIKSEIEEQQRNDISPGLNQSSTSTLGQINGIFASKIAEEWEVLLSIYRSIDPDSATGEALDNLCLLTGIIRLAATKSTVTLTATGTPTTVLPSGRAASVNGNSSARFDTLASATITALSAWTNTHAYVAGDRVTNASRAYQCITAGTSAGSGGPTTTSSDITDGSVHWRYLGQGTGAIDVLAEAEELGPTLGLAATITIIETPVSGWSNVTNFLDASVGLNEETDAALRLRRVATLQIGGKASVDAIRADILAVEDVTQAFVFANATDAADGDGVPAHAIEAVVLGGAADDIAQAIWGSVAAGIKPYGGTSGTATDTAGDDHTVSFSRPTSVNIYHVLNIKIDAARFPSDGDTQIKDKLVLFGATLTIGDDVIASAQIASVFEVSGVLDVSVLQGTAPAPATSATIVTTSRQLAVFDSSRMTVNHV